MLWKHKIYIRQEFLIAGINFSLGRAVFPPFSGTRFLRMKKTWMTGNKFQIASVDHSILTNTLIKNLLYCVLHHGRYFLCHFSNNCTIQVLPETIRRSGMLRKRLLPNRVSVLASGKKFAPRYTSITSLKVKVASWVKL